MNESLGEVEYDFLHFGMKNEYFDGPYTRVLALLLLAQGRRNNISLLFTQLMSLFFRLVVDAQFSPCAVLLHLPSQLIAMSILWAKATRGLDLQDGWLPEHVIEKQNPLGRK